MKRTILVLVSVPLALLLFWIGLRERGPELVSQVQSDDTQHQTALEPGVAAGPDSGKSDLGAGERAAPLAGEERRAVLAEDFDLDSAVWIHGQVVMPEGVPRDEQVFVVASAGRLDAGPMGLGLESREDAARVLSRVAVDSAGTFELPVPEALAEVHVGVRGHYLYSERSTPVATGESERIELSPKLGAWIVGRVQHDGPATLDDTYRARLSLDADGVANIFDGSAWALRETGAQDSHFEFEGVATHDPMRVLALSDSAPAATSERFKLAPGERREIQLTPGAGGTIRGVVLDGDGEPFSGVTVFALDDANFLAGRTGRRVRETLTDAEGRFVLAGVVASALSVRAEREEYLVASARVDLEAGATVEDVRLVLTRGRSISGRVLGADGTVRAGARVSALFDVGKLGGIQGLYAVRGNFQESTTDAKGNFVLSGLGRGPFTISARWLPEGQDIEQLDEGTRARQAFTARAEHVEPGVEEFELQLAPPTMLRGIVRQLDGSPALDFHVQASRASQSLVAEFGQELVRRDFESTDGAFELWGLRPGSWQVQATAPGHAPSEPIAAQVPRPANAPPLEFVLQRQATVAGRVLLPDGTPAQGAKVSVSSNSLERMSRVFHALGEDASSSDAQGAFQLEQLSPGTLALVARARGYAESAPVEVVLSEGLALEDVVLRLRRSATISGEVFSKGGAPAVGDAIIVQLPGSQEMRQTSSDRDGRFLFEDIFPGNWQVIAMPNEDLIAEALEQETGGFGSLVAGVRMSNVELKEGDTQHVVLGEPLPDPVRVFGRVTLDGKGLAGVVVSFVGTASDAGSVRFESADAQGRYEVDLPAAGTYLMLVQRMGQVMAETSLEFPVLIPEAQEHELDIAIPLGRLSGEVRGPGGQLLADARVSLVGANPKRQTFWGGQFTETKTDADGRYSVDWLRPGSYRVTAGGLRFGGMFGEPSPWGRGTGRVVEVGEGEHLRGVDFRLEEGGGVQGVVRDAGGLPVAGAAVFTYDASGRLVERLSFVTSQASGAFEVGALAPGDYSFVARHTSSASARSDSVSVQSGKRTKQDLQLQDGTLLTVEVRGPDGDPVEASVRVLDEHGLEVSGAISFEQITKAMQGGSAQMLRQIGPLAPGRYVVSASVPGLGSAERKVTLRGRPSKHTTLRLK